MKSDVTVEVRPDFPTKTQDLPHSRIVPKLSTVQPSNSVATDPVTKLKDSVPTPPNLNRYALSQRFGSPLLVSNNQDSALTYNVGDREEFHLVDLERTSDYTIEAELVLSTQNAYWYVELGVELPLTQLRSAAQVFEETIRPRLVSFFGDRWEPGVNGALPLTILHARLNGASGYFNSSDEYPRLIMPNSNERRIIYIDSSHIEIASVSYYKILSHEFQHAIHWDYDPGEEAWINEGLSELAALLVGYPPTLGEYYQRSPQTQLNSWSGPTQDSLAHYGASYLFFLYLFNHYGGYENIKQLVTQPTQGIHGLNAYLKSMNYEETFVSIFRDWVVANYVSKGEGRYGYPHQLIPASVSTINLGYGKHETSLPQFSPQYFKLPTLDTATELSVLGKSKVGLIPTTPYSGDFCWWSNSGDFVNSRMFREFDLTSVDKATLFFQTWYDIEQDWDHAYIVASTNGGKTWNILEGNLTNSTNQLGMSYGPSLTGRSNGWLQESVDLSEYARGKVMVGIEYVTDDTYSGAGLCLDDIRIPEISYIDDAETSGDWSLEGFLRTNNHIDQQLTAQVIRVKEDSLISVSQIPLNEENHGTVTLEPSNDPGETTVVVIAPVTKVTRQPAIYTLTLTQVQ